MEKLYGILKDIEIKSEDIDKKIEEKTKEILKNDGLY
ncbi:hypothetical protein MJ1_0354 [Nanobdella aerobiophila]|uniref:Uncharacterized protein n=1 Tax=Nanobdella aerobiophila TaxID=2586965 RepID=A0A915SKA1_9ARCH|nr:hypothetical protein MJ1_0354 [Nanobdella aerobiophila]